MGANDRQEGGTHYAQDGNLQHWDLVLTYEWDYFQAQITKYLMRWKRKHDSPEKRLEDLKKARHFLDKYIEAYNVYDTKTTPSETSEVATTGLVAFEKFERDSTSYLSDVMFLCEGGRGNGLNLYTCKYCKAQGWYVSLTCAHYEHVCVQSREEPTEPTGAYVKQGGKYEEF